MHIGKEVRQIEVADVPARVEPKRTEAPVTEPVAPTRAPKDPVPA